jgi:hypothetical protein
MINTSVIPCESAPRSARAITIAVRVIALLTLYICVAVFHDPLPPPARQIAGVVVAWLTLGVITWLWVLWSRPQCARPSVAWRLIISVGALIFAYVMFKVTNFDPLPRPWGKLVEMPLFPLGLGAIMWWTAHNRDEVQRAAAFEGFAWGALVGVGLIFAGIYVVRYAPGIADWLQTVASRARNGLPPAAVGFAFGAIFSLMVVWMSMFIGRGLWWRSKL